MSRTVATVLLDLAACIAPSHRRDWIAGLRAEAAVADHPARWAWGALTTATRQRLADIVASGLALRLALGGFVIGVAACFAIFITVRIPDIEAVSARTHRDLLPVVLMLAAIPLVLSSGGLAIVLSRRTPWVNRYGRLLFTLGGLYVGFKLASAGFESRLWHTATALQHQMATLSAIAGPLFIAAALALLFRRGRLFLVLASGALGMEIAQYGVELPHLPHGALPAIAFFSACAPGLLMLAAFGLVTGRKAPIAA